MIDVEGRGPYLAVDTYAVAPQCEMFCGAMRFIISERRHLLCYTRPLFRRKIK